MWIKSWKNLFDFDFDFVHVRVEVGEGGGIGWGGVEGWGENADNCNWITKIFLKISLKVVEEKPRKYKAENKKIGE